MNREKPLSAIELKEKKKLTRTTIPCAYKRKKRVGEHNSKVEFVRTIRA